MLKKIMVSIAFLLSFSSHAENIIVNDTPPLYKFSFVRYTESENKEILNKSSVNFYAVKEIGKPFPIVATTNEDQKKSTKCELLVSDNQVSAAVNLNFNNSSGFEFIIYPIEATNKSVKLMISLVESNVISSSDMVVINDSCSFSNSVINTTNLQWFGDVEIDKPTVIKIQGKESLLVTIKKAIK